jgi:hypothetical protein
MSGQLLQIGQPGSLVSLSASGNAAVAPSFPRAKEGGHTAPETVAHIRARGFVDPRPLPDHASSVRAGGVVASLGQAAVSPTARA